MTSSNSSNIFPYMDVIITGFYNNRCLKSGDAVHRWSQDMATYIPALLRDLRKGVYATPAVRCYRSSLTPGVGLVSQDPFSLDGVSRMLKSPSRAYV